MVTTRCAVRQSDRFVISCWVWGTSGHVTAGGATCWAEACSANKSSSVQQYARSLLTHLHLLQRRMRGLIPCLTLNSVRRQGGRPCVDYTQDIRCQRWLFLYMVQLVIVHNLYMSGLKPILRTRLNYDQTMTSCRDPPLTSNTHRHINRNHYRQTERKEIKSVCALTTWSVFL